jgi:hypothetical protein
MWAGCDQVRTAIDRSAELNELINGKVKLAEASEEARAVE